MTGRAATARRSSAPTSKPSAARTPTPAARCPRNSGSGRRARGTSTHRRQPPEGSLDLIGAFVDALEETRREVTLAGVGKHGKDDRAARRLGRDLRRRREGAAGRQTAEDAFALREVAGPVAGLEVSHAHDLVDNLAV